MFSRRLVTIAIIVQTLIFATLFMMISSTQQIFDLYFGKSATFPLWFGFIAIVAGTASVANAQLVGRLGMRFLIRNTLNVVAAGSAIMLILLVFGLWPEWAEFPAYVVFSIAIFGTMGLTIGNLNALAMEPLGHIAGMAASVIGAVATVLSVVIAAPVGLAFDGTPVPLATGIFLAFAVARLAMLWLPND